MAVTKPEFWEREWLEAIKNSPVRRRERTFGAESMKRWNRMAKDFARRISDQHAIARRRQVIEGLCTRGILTRESRVLDIGAGPGAWTLPLAEQSRHVTALEPANVMADILKSRLRESGVANVSIKRETWQSADLDALGWRNAFDLVFAAMTPGVDGPSTLKKMMKASRGYCYLSTFAGPGYQSQYAPLWEIFFKEPLGQTIYDIIYPFNLVYTLGYRPGLTFSRWEGRADLARDEAVRMFTSFFENYMEITRDTRSVIEDYINRHSVEGRYLRPGNIRIGTMIWHFRHQETAAN